MVSAHIACKSFPVAVGDNSITNKINPGPYFDAVIGVLCTASTFVLPKSGLVIKTEVTGCNSGATSMCLALRLQVMAAIVKCAVS